jgi:hypothetical protein
MAIRKLLLPLISTSAGEAALSTAWTVAQLWNAHMLVLHVQMDLAPAPAMSAMFQRFTVEHRVRVAEATTGAESATASFLISTGRKLDILPQQARLADLTVVRHPATPEEVSSSDVLHAVLFDSGRPLLIAPRWRRRQSAGGFASGGMARLSPPPPWRRQCLGWSAQKLCAFSGLKSINDMVRKRQSFRPTWRCMVCRLI